MTDALPTIVFVYNAESGMLNKLRDAVHKTFSPATYPCKLCDVTYSPVRMRSRWKRFVRELPCNVEFSYTDLIEQAVPGIELDYPCACLRTVDGLYPWLSADQINACDTLDELIELVDSALRDSDLLADTSATT